MHRLSNVLLVGLLLSFCSLSYSSTFDAGAASPLLQRLMPGSARQIHELSRESLWGTHRPNVYVGVRARAPFSPLLGLMWFDADRLDALNHVRHDCDERDQTKFGYDRHDGAWFASHNAADTFSGVKISHRFVKQAVETPNGLKEAWSLKIDGEKITDNKNISVIWYVNTHKHPEVQQSLRLVEPALNAKSTQPRNKIVVEGDGGDAVGRFRIAVPASESNSHPHILKPSVTQQQPEKVHLNSVFVAGVNLKNKMDRLTDAEKVAMDFIEDSTSVKDKLSEEEVWNIKEDAVLPILRKNGQQKMMNMQEYFQSGSLNIPPNTDPQTFMISEIKRHGVFPTLSNKVEKDSNVLMFQQVFELPFSFEILFESAGDDARGVIDSRSPDSLHFLPSATADQISSDPVYGYSSALHNAAFRAERTAALTASFKQRFDRFLHEGQKTSETDKHGLLQFALSNMMGSNGYFFGRQQLQAPESRSDLWTSFRRFSRNGAMKQNAHLPRPQQLQAAIEAEHAVDAFEFSPLSSLFCSVPSRSFFPRGFSWDDGFHQLVIQQFAPLKSYEILRSWMHQVTETGWLPREQILSPEAKNRVPAQFRVQKSTVANPPPLFLATLRAIEREYLTSNTEKHDELQHMFEAVNRHTRWLLHTQRAHGAMPHSDAEPDAEGAMIYGWEGRTADHCLASGLDDYPRAPVLDTVEAHVDLHAWLVVLTRRVAEVAKLLNQTDIATEMSTVHEHMLSHFNLLFWDTNSKQYADVYWTKDDKKHFVQHKGYVALFPLLLRVIDTSDDVRLNAMLDLISDSNGIWSSHGLRSLSRSDALFGTKENYWRGSIWININFMAVSSLQWYAEHAKSASVRTRCADLSAQLRRNVVNNMQNVYASSGSIWEQYSGTDGAGLRSNPFTGWSALVVNLAANKLDLWGI